MFKLNFVCSFFSLHRPHGYLSHYFIFFFFLAQSMSFHSFSFIFVHFLLIWSESFCLGNITFCMPTGISRNRNEMFSQKFNFIFFSFFFFVQFETNPKLFDRIEFGFFYKSAISINLNMGLFLLFHFLLHKCKLN